MGKEKRVQLRVGVKSAKRLSRGRPASEGCDSGSVLSVRQIGLCNIAGELFTIAQDWIPRSVRSLSSGWMLGAKWLQPASGAEVCPSLNYIIWLEFSRAVFPMTFAVYVPRQVGCGGKKNRRLGLV
ncbi:uncharacterized protein LOC129720637 [Wyeomyia smithii]|uniref:uncharacterized protein LOC129720637 n=1 Tax=Wyeomyia smithii TaxID=174621 RepID=UPI002467C612|nr:uncharacterized protein LOC129720637 [Wyeomyia smithii]